MPLPKLCHLRKFSLVTRNYRWGPPASHPVSRGKEQRKVGWFGLCPVFKLDSNFLLRQSPQVAQAGLKLTA